MGIPGAPATLGTPMRGSVWTVCDEDRTVVTIGPGARDEPADDRPVLLTPRGEGPATTYLSYDGRRAAVDLRDRAVVEALRLSDVAPVSVSSTLLDLLPEVPAITTPRIAGAGEPGPAALGGATVGSVLQVRRADGTDRYVVLREGVQRVGEVFADLVGFTHGSIATASPAAIAAVPVADTVVGATLPRHATRPRGAADHVTVCARWRPRGRGAETNTVVYADGGACRRRRELAQADGDGPLVDAVAISGGTSVFVDSARIVGDGWRNRATVPGHRCRGGLRGARRRGGDVARARSGPRTGAVAHPRAPAPWTGTQRRGGLSPSRRARRDAVTD